MDQIVSSPGARRLRPWGTWLPITLIVALQVLRNYVLRPRMGASMAADVTGAITIVGVIIFSIVIWRLAERAEAEMAAVYAAAQAHERQLVALHEATLSMTAALDLPTVLRRVVEESRAVIGSRYGAVAVVGRDGGIDEFVTSGLDQETMERLGAPPTGHGLLGLVISDRRPLRVADIPSHPHSVGFPPDHPPMRTLLAVPLVYQGTVVGSLYLTDRNDGLPFTEEDQETLDRFAAQAAIAVANARLYGELQRLSLVEERERISMDLHDGVMQTLYATGLGLEATLEDIDVAPPAAKEGVERAIARLHGTISDIRHYIFDLRAAQQDSGEGLRARLRQLLDGIPNPTAQVALQADGFGPEPPKRVQWECWHIAREAVSNALRHAQCRHVTVELDSPAGELLLRITDDGAGFDPGISAGEGHRGLRNMRRRAEAIGGRLDVRSQLGSGTVVTLAVPLRGEGGST